MNRREMNKYRKKPVVIDAVQFTTTNRRELIDSIPDAYQCREQETGNILGNTIFIDTLEGGDYANLNDWIIKGIAGEYYPCKPDIFAATYEPADS